MAKTLPKVYYGLHMAEGVAEYAEPNTEPYRILVSENAIKNMDPTFQGKPVYVDHVDGVDLANLQNEADGYVMESFYNPPDGKHWVKFIVVSDSGHEAIRKGFKLSNAYIPKTFTNGGLWHGVEYLKEVMSGEYEHLAIVANPRYEESRILTPEQFKVYNEGKEFELAKLKNSHDEVKGANEMKLNLFKKSKVENSSDLEAISVTLPKSGKEMSIVELVSAHDAILNMNGYANGDHMVKAGEEEMSVNDLAKKYMEMKNEMAESAAKKENAEDEDESVDNAEDEDESVDNAEDDVEEEEKKKEKKENAADAVKNAAEKKKAAKEKADALRNAHLNAREDEPAPVEMMDTQIQRGKSRYGS